MKLHLYFLSLAVISLSLPGAKAQNALNFDGTDDYVLTTFVPMTGGGARTVEAWIRTSANCVPAAGGHQIVIADWGTTGTGTRFTFNVLYNNAIRLEVSGSGFNGNVPVNDGLWHHVAGVYDPLASLKFRLYVDGQLDSAGNNTTTVNTASGPLRIGRRIDDANPFNGDIDEVRIWDKALTQSEILSNINAEFCNAPANLIAYYTFNQGVAGANNSGITTLYDNSGNGHHGTLTNFTLNGTASNWTGGAPITPGNTFNTIVEYSCDAYVSPSGNHVWTTSGMYTDTLPNAAGCDSVITVDLTIVQVDLQLGMVGITLIANAINAYYQWLDCDDNMAPIPGATSQQFTPTSNGNYACMVTQYGCTDTTICVPVTTVGGMESMQEEQIIILPNPTTSGEFVIQGLEADKVGYVQVCDLTGRVVLQRTVLTSDEMRFRVAEPGMYLVAVFDKDGGREVQKVLFLR